MRPLRIGRDKDVFIDVEQIVAVGQISSIFMKNSHLDYNCPCISVKFTLNSGITLLVLNDDTDLASFNEVKDETKKVRNQIILAMTDQSIKHIDTPYSVTFVESK
jgi:hypothetical protein